MYSVSGVAEFVLKKSFQADDEAIVGVPVDELTEELEDRMRCASEAYTLL